MYVVGYGNPYLDYGDVIGVSHQVIVKQVMPFLQSSSNLTTEVHYVCRTQIKEAVSTADIVKMLESDFVESTSEDDHAARGITITSKQRVASNWFAGPNFLWQKKQPSGEVKVGEIASSDLELKKAQVYDT